jgi:hypothetical protein
MSTGDERKLENLNKFAWSEMTTALNKKRKGNYLERVARRMMG